jgi:hypothetical protein
MILFCRCAFLYLINPETQPSFTAMYADNRLNSRGIWCVVARPSAPRRAPSSLQGSIHGVACKRAPDTSVT